jgi:hypothetical protein
MSDIKIDLIAPSDEVVTVYNPDGSKLVTTNDVLLFDHIRCQIKSMKAEGYSVQFKDIRIKIDSEGRTDRSPIGFF